ncbi:MAG: DUF4249 family protein [Bacteroidota bacterium]
MRKSSCLVAVIFALWNCNSLTEPIEIELPNFEKQFAVHALLLDKDTNLYLKIDETIGLDEVLLFNTNLNENLLFDPLIDNPSLDVRISKEDGNEIVFEYLPNEKRPDNFFGNNYIAHLDKPLGKNVGKLKLSIRGKSLPFAKAEVTMPTLVPLVSSKLIPNIGDGKHASPFINVDSVDGLNITFWDPKEKENYYELRIIGKSKNEESDILNFYISNYMTSLNPELKGGRSRFYISDKNFNGEEFSFTILLGLNSVSSESKIVWRSISKEWYEFYTSLSTNSLDQTFTEPNNAYSNIENGSGVFAVGNEIIYPINL